MNCIQCYIKIFQEMELADQRDFFLFLKCIFKMYVFKYT